MLVFSLLTGIVVISDYQLNIFTVLDDLCTAQYPGNMAERENRWEIPAFINARIWLGLEQYEHEWRRMQQEGEVAVFAETVSRDTRYNLENIERALKKN